MRLSVVLCMSLAVLTEHLACGDEPPKSLDPRLKIELFAEHPQIVTPTGLDVDHRGRVFAIESNTHFPPEGYKGHPTDRVLVMNDTNGDGKADKIVVFKDGLRHSMSVVVRPLWFPVSAESAAQNPEKVKTKKSDSKLPGSQLSTLNSQLSLYIATRREILQFHDDDGDDKADREERIVHLDTQGDYPHNGLGGFAIDALGWLYFGFGENLGADYKIIGSDGTTLSGGGEGGNIYRCRLDGSKLSHIATGFWNPHASCFDAFGRLFTVDNDPDSRPPCRLLHVIPGGDYGYRFRNGRKGLHPFTAWNGEIPGTLPMVAGTGEAPSGIVAYESDGLPEEFIGNLLVTSWGDHRIDHFRLHTKGTSFTALAEPLITGGENFRPVGLATAPDGSLFCTDWVLRDYKLHGHGRIWRIAPKESRTTPVIALDSLPTQKPEHLAGLLASPRRDVRRMAAQVRATFKTQPSGLSRAIHPIIDHARQDIEILWQFKRLVRQAPGTMPLDYQILDHDDPFLGWLASTPGVPDNFPRAGIKYSKQALINLVANRDRSLEQFGPSVLPFVTSNLRIGDADELFRVATSVDDPFIFASMVSWASRRLKQDDFAKYLIPDGTPDVKPSPPKLRQAMLLAARKQAPKDDRLLRVALADPDADVRRLAVQWAAEEKLTDLKPRVEAVFDGKGMTPELFLATLAALEMLDGKKPEDFDKTPADQYVVPLLKDEKRSPAVRAQALRLVSPTDKSLDGSFFARLLKSDNELLRVETIRTLQLAPPDVSGELLRELVANDKLDVQLRADAMVGLAAVAKAEPIGGPSRKLLRTFLHNRDHSPLRREALRAVRRLVAEDAELREGVLDVANTPMFLFDGATATELFDQITLAFAESKLELPQKVKLSSSAKPNDRQEWIDQLNRGRDADPAAGRRIFFHPNGPGCFKCHTIDGRGGRVGPDLSRAVGTMNRIQLIQSILEPSREIAPQFVAWTFELQDGKVVTGMVVHENEGKTIVGDNEGKLTELKTIDIETRTPQKVSVMPDKLAERMTLQELRDLLAYLDSQR